MKTTFQKKRMPDGHNYIQANQIIYKNVTRKHSGTYICEGSNGPGQIVSDEIKVDILRKLTILVLKATTKALHSSKTTKKYLISFIFFFRSA